MVSALDVQERRQQIAKLVDGNGEPDVLGVAADGGVDADELAQHVEQRPPRIARVDAGVGLDQVFEHEITGEF